VKRLSSDMRAEKKGAKTAKTIDFSNLKITRAQDVAKVRIAYCFYCV
jgi:hypothetical protein